MDVLFEDLNRPERDRLKFWLKERIRFRETSIFNFDDGCQMAETGLLRSISINSADKLRRVAKMLDIQVYTVSYSNLWWKDSFEFDGYEFMALRRKEKFK